MVVRAAAGSLLAGSPSVLARVMLVAGALEVHRASALEVAVVALANGNGRKRKACSIPVEALILGTVPTRALYPGGGVGHGAVQGHVDRKGHVVWALAAVGWLAVVVGPARWRVRMMVPATGMALLWLR